MDAFTALAEPTRRNILEILASNGRMPASAIYKRFQASPPAISQHLKVLRETNLVTVETTAQQRIYSINPETMKELEKWIHQFAYMTEKQSQKLDALSDKMKQEAPLLPFDKGQA